MFWGETRIKAWANVRPYTIDASSSAKRKCYNVRSEVVRLVLEFTQECDYIWFTVYQTSLALGRLYTPLLFGNLSQVRVLWKLIAVRYLQFYNNSVLGAWFLYNWRISNREETYAPTNWAGTVKNFRPQTAEKAQCSSCLLDTQLQPIVNTTCTVPCFCFFLLLPFSKTLFCPFVINVRPNPLSARGTRSHPPHTPCWASNIASKSGSCGSRLADRRAGGSPLVGPLLGGVVRSDDIRLGHHPVLVLREGVAIWRKKGWSS